VHGARHPSVVNGMGSNSCVTAAVSFALLYIYMMCDAPTNIKLYTTSLSCNKWGTWDTGMNLMPYHIYCAAVVHVDLLSMHHYCTRRVLMYSELLTLAQAVLFG